MADELIYMFSTLSIIKEINSVNCKGYVKKKNRNKTRNKPVTYQCNS